MRFYRIYLWRFPVIALSPGAAGMSVGPRRARVQVLVTLAATALSWRCLERPIITGALGRIWAMRRALFRARELGRLKSDFVASVSHELRAPVASMRLMAENLDAGAVPTEARRREYHRHIAGECRRLAALIDNVLVYWLTNTLLEDLSNEQMLSIARSAKPLH